jgi:hypothetical protein
MDRVWNRVIWISFFSGAYVASLAFWVHFFPWHFDLSQDNWQILRSLVSCSVSKNKTVNSIKNGQFDRDYFALKAKPFISYLVIDENSAAVMKNSHNTSFVLFSGSWHLNRGDCIQHVFDLRPAAFLFGPDTNRNPFTVFQQTNENLRELNSLGLEIKNTVCQTSDGVKIVPVFKIFYAWKQADRSDSLIRQLLQVAMVLESANYAGEAKKQLEGMLGSLVAERFSEVAKTIEFNAIQAPGQKPGQAPPFFQHLLDNSDFLIKSMRASENKIVIPFSELFSLKIDLWHLWKK